MDNRDEIIKTQLEGIGDLIHHNMSRMGEDFWGTPAAPKAPEQAEKPSQPKPQSPKPQQIRQQELSARVQPQEQPVYPYLQQERQPVQEQQPEVRERKCRRKVSRSALHWGWNG